MSYIGNTSTTQAFTPAVDFFNGNGSTTAFTLSRPVASVAQVQAVISNVPQKPGDAFTVSGNTITFTSAPPSGTSNIYVYYTSPITQVIAPGQGTVTTTSLMDGSVTTAKIADANVTPAKLSTGAPTWDTNGRISIAGSGYTLSPTTLIAGQYSSTLGYVQVPSAGQFDVWNNGTEHIASFFNNRTVRVAKTIGVGEATPSTSGAGITFPATQSASSDANTLDDYEEGTFTPTLNFGGGTTGITYQNNGRQGTYVKVGRFVTATVYIYLSNKGSSTGTMQISGLPFASDSSSPNYIDYYFPLGARNAFTLSAGQFPFFYLGTGSSQVIIYYTSLTTGGQPTQVTNTAAANLLEISLQFTYRTAS